MESLLGASTKSRPLRMACCTWNPPQSGGAWPVDSGKPHSEALLEAAIRNATARLSAAIAAGASDGVLAARALEVRRLKALRIK